MAAFYGIELTKKDLVGCVTINWKQGSFLGIGGDHSQKYNIFNYETPHKSLVPLYVQHDYVSPDKIVCNEKMQYGMNNGVFFVVLHDKSQTPYQHRFIQTEIQRNLYRANEILKNCSANYVDMSWAAGDYLHTFSSS